MFKKPAYFIVAFLLLITACNNAAKKQGIGNGDSSAASNTYYSKDLQWTINIPTGYTVMGTDQINANDQKGREAVEKVYGETIPMDSLKNLITFQKDKFNLFGSSIEPFREEYPGEYIENNRNINALIYETFKSQGIHADTASGKETIQGLEFSVFYSTIYGPDGKVILNQILYSKLQNGYDFGVNINYNNTADRDILLSVWKNSVFGKR
ncbi:MAG: hypothetical protein V4613_13010 [Bacteroidota bacterium]